MTKIIITSASDGSFTVRVFGGKPHIFRTLIEELKARVPSGQRNYDPESKSWPVRDEALLNDWVEFAKRLGATPEWRNERRVPSGHENAFVTLHLLPTAPPELVKAAHRELVKLHHPDRGGDLETMQKVNAAYDLLKTEVGRRPRLAQKNPPAGPPKP